MDKKYEVIIRKTEERLNTVSHTGNLLTLFVQIQVIHRRQEQKLKRPVALDQEIIKKKWVVDASSRDLNKDKISLFRKGLNYAITLRTVPIKEILESVEESISRLPKNHQEVKFTAH